jgi:hypothetical protein
MFPRHPIPDAHANPTTAGRHASPRDGREKPPQNRHHVRAFAHRLERQKQTVQRLPLQQSMP